MTETPRIPIRNIYYLFLYAWNRFEEGKALAMGAECSPDLPNLLARVLLSGTRSLVRRGLDRGYHPFEEDLATIRGKIELEGTVALRARHVPRVSCSFDELSHDVLPNQIIKATLARLGRSQNIDVGLGQQLRQLTRSLSDISDIRLTAGAFARVRLHRNNAYYDLLLRVCRLAFDLMLPDVNGSGFAFTDVLRDERKMAAVFEEFVRNFYRTEQRQFRVKPLQLQWAATPIGFTQFRLPTMRTDIYLESDTRRIIIDTKYYANALQHYQGSESFRSDNLYQLFAYLRNDALSLAHAISAEGMLLYPTTAYPLDEQFVIDDHPVRIATVDLSEPWHLIDGKLRSLANSPGPTRERNQT